MAKTAPAPPRMVRKVVHLPPNLLQRADEYLATRKAEGSCIGLPELIRQALHTFLAGVAK